MTMFPPPPESAPRARTEPVCDPGSRPGLVFTLLVGLVVVVATLQQLGGRKAASPPASPPGASAAIVEIKPPPYDQQQVFARLFVRMANADPQFREAASGGVATLQVGATADADAVRLIPVIAELMSPAAAEQRAKELLGLQEFAPLAHGRTTIPTPKDAKPLPADSSLRDDVQAILDVYSQPGPVQLDDATRTRLVARHGYFGRLVLAADPASPDRAPLVGGGMAVLVFFPLFGLTVAGALLFGLVLLIVGLVKYAGGRLPMRYVRPIPGGSLPVEMVAVFFAGFLSLKVLSALIQSAVSPATATTATLLLQWSLILLIFYPRLRGMSGPDARAMLGLHSGRGVLREVGAGIAGYLALLPIYALVAVGALVLIFVEQAIRTALGAKTAAPPSNPIFDLAGGLGPFQLFLMGTLATIWAPIVEEVFFRGALMRHLTGWMHWLIAAILTALAFAVAHNYAWQLLILIATLGTGFGFMRAWRGSLIAPITAHFIHNSFITIVIAALVTLAGTE